MIDDSVVGRITALYERGIREMWDVVAGGRLRALKGKLVENLCEEMVRIAWGMVGGDPDKMLLDRRTYYIENGKGNRYGISQDKQVYVDGRFILSIECKAYAEVAMYKRILVDSLLLKNMFPGLKFCLFQLESMLGGDFATNPSHPSGSASVNLLNSQFPAVQIDIVTLLDGERDIRREIHKRDFYKPMSPDRVRYALDYFRRCLSPYA